MKIAVTGSAGFLGSSLVKKLNNEYPECEVIEIDRKYGWDILDIKNLEERLLNFDVLIHLAALTHVPTSYENPYLFYNINVLGTLNVLEICRKLDKPIIYLSSYMYGHPQYIPIDEKHPVSAVNPYGQSKLFGEQLCASYTRDFDVRVVSLRLFNLYGPGQDKNFLLAKIIDGAKNGLVQLDDPTPKRDYIYIDDVLNAITKLALNPNYIGFETYNIGYGKSHSVEEIVDMVKIYYPQAVVNFTSKKRPNEILDTLCDNEKAKTNLGWYPMVNLQEGIERIILNKK